MPLSMEVSRVVRRAMIAAAVSSVVGVSAIADVVIMPGGRAAANEMKDLNAVFVRDSSIATEKMALAERMERLKEWDKSADVYQEVIDKYADRVIPTRSDDTGAIAQYTSVALVVQERLSKWPEEGLRVYRLRYEDRAQELLTSAGNDREPLQRLFTQYFATDSGKSAGLRLLSLSLERGEFASAAWVGKRLLSHHPAVIVERPMVLFKTAIAEHLAGAKSGAEARLAELKQRFPNASGTLRGVDVNLAETLAKELTDQPSLVRAFRSDSWPVPFGSPDAGAVPEQVSFGGAKLFSIDIVRPKRSTRSQSSQFQTMFNDARRLGGLTGILPSIDNGEMYFQDNARIYAISLTSGMPLPAWQQRYTGDKRGAFSVDAAPTPRGKLLGVSLTEKSVFAVLGQSDMLSMQMTGRGGNSTAQLVSLDRSSGKHNWSVTMKKLTIPEEFASLRDGRVQGTPLVIDNTVYVLVSAARGGQFEECHLVALRASDGSYLWSSYVASTATGGIYDFDGSGLSNDSSSMLSYSDGRVYVLTNLGALACIDAADGKTHWLNVYPRNPQPGMNQRFVNRGFINSREVSKPFTQSPPMVVDGRLFVAPSDSPHIFVYDAASGEELKRIPRQLERAKFKPVDMLLGVVGDKLVLGNKSTIFVIPWQTFDPRKSIANNGGMYKVLQAAGGGTDDQEAIRGRPLVTGKYVFVPASDKLYRITLDDMRLEGFYPPQGMWDAAEEAPGNVVATPDHLVLAGSDRVTVYTDLSVATRKLDEQIAKDPSDAEPYLRYAELLLAGGSATDAVDWLDKAAERMGGRESLQKGALRDRMFEIACGFAIKLQRTESSSPEVVRQLFLRASEAADSASQQVRYRLAHAQLHRKNSDATAEIELHQQILAEPAWRVVSVSGRAGSTSAGVEAEAAITELVTQDPTLYAPYDARAAELFATASADESSSPDALLAIADEFPVSKSALPALQVAADRFEASQQTRDATRTYRRILSRADNQTVRVNTLEALARNYASLPNQLDLALVRLEQAAKLDAKRTLSKPIRVGKDTIQQRSLADAASALRIKRDLQEREALPTLNLPSGVDDPNKAAFEKPVELAGVSAIIPQQGTGRADRLVAFRKDSTVIQLQAGTVTPLHAPVAIEDKPVGACYSGDSLVVVSGTGIVSLKPDGKQAWRVSLGSIPGVELMSEPEPEKAPVARGNDEPFLGNNGVVVINGRVRRIGFNGNVLPDEPAETGPERIAHFRVLSDRVVVATSTGRIASFDLTDGVLSWQTRVAEASIQRFDAIDDFVVASGTDSMGDTDLVVLDTISGRIIQHDQYLPNNGQTGRQFANFALSRDGVLVTTYMVMMQRQSRMCSIDLFDTSTKVDRAVSNERPGEMPFAQANGDNQLVITAGRVLAVHMPLNNTAPTVRVYNLRDLKPMLAGEKTKKGNSEAIFSAGGPNNPNRGPQPIRVHAAGSSFYITSEKAMAAFNLDRDSKWQPLSTDDRGILRDLVITQDYCLLINQPKTINSATATKLSSVLISAHSRQPQPDGTESGLVEHRPLISDPAGILANQWQATNGAFYYVSGDQKLKMLKANP